MDTKIIRMDKHDIDIAGIRYAAGVIKDGGLVAFPTETVYGLGANALSEAAVKSIFLAKGRPSDNPLIVHIHDKTEVSRLVSDIPPSARQLMDRFWPGPLTLVMKKSALVPGIITAGLDTVAIRIPQHPVALALIRESGLPIAAPSANTSGKPSPTNAGHVIDDLMGKVDVIIDAGDTNVGLESTVLDITITPPMILRPGNVTHEELEELLKSVSMDPAVNSGISGKTAPRAPGMKYTHYSPKADVIVVEGSLENVTSKIRSVIAENNAKGISTGVLATDQTKANYSSAEILSMGDRDYPHTIAASLFRTLRELDEKHVRVIIAEAIDSTGIGLAVMNRLNKAAGYNIIRV